MFTVAVPFERKFSHRENGEYATNMAHIRATSLKAYIAHEERDWKAMTRSAAEIGCGIPLSTAAAVILMLAAEPGGTCAVEVCPRVAPYLRTSLFLQWEALSSQACVRVTPSCRCADRATGTKRLRTEGSRRALDTGSNGTFAAMRLAAQLGLSPPARAVAEALDQNSRAIASCRNSEAGLTGVLIGTGPSLNALDLRRFDGIPSVGCNKLFLLDETYRFRPRHLVVEDRLVLDDAAEALCAYKGSRKWYPIDHYGIADAEYYFPLWRQYEPFPQFTSNFSHEVFTGWTVSYIMIQLAVFLGWSRLLLVGMDGIGSLPRAMYQGPVAQSMEADHNHFDPRYYGPGQRFHQPRAEATHAALELARDKLAVRGVEIINCSPLSKLSLFPKQSLDELEIE